MGSIFMDLDAVTSPVCGTACFEGLPVNGEQQRKIQSKSQNSMYCSPIVFSRKKYFPPKKILAVILRILFTKEGRKNDLKIIFFKIEEFPKIYK